jgi:hypothetical protein
MAMNSVKVQLLQWDLLGKVMNRRHKKSFTSP